MSLPWLAAAAARLDEAAARKRQAHALMLVGPRGLGKRELALREAAALLCLADARPACGQCRSCELAATGAHPDFRLVTLEPNEKGQMRKEIVVDQVRDLIASLQLTHGLSARKVAVIHPAETLNRHAANALLKTLEEPAGVAFLLLVCNDATRLPATVRSRCQVIEVRLPEADMAEAWLMAGLNVGAETARLALESAAGSPLLAADLVRSGGLDDYRSTRAWLERLEAEPGLASQAFSSLSALEPPQCWHWLSLASAARVRAAMTTGHGTARRRLASMLRLQSLSDRNHRLLATAVRHDLLLRDWLVQWAALARA